MDRLPIRVKLTLAFAGAMTAVLAATGLFLYVRFAADLDAAVNQGLRSRAADVAALIREADAGLRESGQGRLAKRGESFAQILGGDGKVVDSTPQVGRRPLLTAAEIRRVQARTTLLERGPVPGFAEPSRLLATSVFAQDQRLVVVVGASLEERDDALASLATLLLVGGPFALLLASGAGYGVAAAALRPVEAMRRRAAAITTASPDERLPVGEARDELASLGETLNEMLDRLDEAFARERTFVADASHELRTPLAILQAEIDLALSQRRSPDEYRAALHSAHEEAARLVQLAEDLLVIARSDQGRLPVRMAEVQLEQLLNATRLRFERRAADAGRTIEVANAVDHRVVGDPLRLEQALGNLVDNALRHGSGTICLLVRSVDVRVELHVRDAGPGFPEGYQAEAFQRFSRADVARGRGGAGLGLAIVAAIAEAHSGGVAAENASDGGADVWIWLPREPDVSNTAA